MEFPKFQKHKDVCSTNLSQRTNCVWLESIEMETVASTNTNITPAAKPATEWKQQEHVKLRLMICELHWIAVLIIVES